MSDINRRDFMKTAGVTAAGFAIASGYSPFTYAQNSKIRVGCIGVGGQGTFHIREGLTKNDAFQIIALSDVYSPNQKAAVPLIRLSNAKVYLAENAALTDEQKAAASAQPAPSVHYDYKEVLANPDVDAVVIATPLTTHAQIAMDALDAGKFVFCEKTLVRTVEEGRALIQKCHDLNKWVQVGHQRRYNPKYNLGMWMAHDTEQIGRITHITAQWHRNQQWRRPVPKDYVLNEEEKKYIPDFEKHLNWRLYDEISGGLYTELMTHQTDIANWFLKAVPSRVYSVSGLDYWRDGRTAQDNIVVVFEYNIKRSMPGFHAMKPRTTLMDESSANRNYTVRFVYTSILGNSKRGCAELIQGDRGTLELTEIVSKFYPEPWVLEEAAAKEKEKAKANMTAEEQAKQTSSGGSMAAFGMGAVDAGVELFGSCDDLKIPDAYQFEAFANCIQNGGIPRNNQMVGYTTALTAIAAMQSRDSGGPVDIDPAWYTFDFEVPSFYEYDPSWSTKKCEAPKCPCCGKPLPKKPVTPCSECGQPLPPVKPGEQAVPCPAKVAPPAPAEGAAPAAPAAPAPAPAPAPAAPAAPAAPVS